MTDTTDEVTVLRETLNIIRERGWSPMFSIKPSDPVNLRQAISAATSRIYGHGPSKQWHAAYLGAASALGRYLQAGISSWEFDVKSAGEVELMLIEVINRLAADVPA